MSPDPSGRVVALRGQMRQWDTGRLQMHMAKSSPNHGQGSGDRFEGWDWQGIVRGWRRDYGMGKGKCYGKGKGRDHDGDLWEEHFKGQGKGKGRNKWNHQQRPQPYHAMDDARADPPPEAHPEPPPSVPEAQRCDRVADTDGLRRSGSTSSQGTIAPLQQVPDIYGQGAQDFMSAPDIMAEDIQKYWVVKKRDPNGFMCKSCTLCKRYPIHGHIGYKSKSVHRERRFTSN